MSLLDTLTREPLTVPFKVGLGTIKWQMQFSPHPQGCSSSSFTALIGFVLTFIPLNCPDRLHLIHHGGLTVLISSAGNPTPPKSPRCLDAKYG